MQIDSIERTLSTDDHDCAQVLNLLPHELPSYSRATRERRMVQPMKIDSNSCKTLREVTEA
jgi:hypothetical protein